MNNELPPKMVKAQLVRLDDNLKQIERRQVAGIQRAPGSLPVLEAFQAFLENEQRKARRRMLVVTAFAVLLMCAVAGGGFVLVQRQLSQAAIDLKTVGNRTEAMAATVESLKRDQDAELLALENRFRDESSQIITQYTSLQQEQQALVEKFNASKLETVETRLQRLEAENESLLGQLAALQAGQIVAAPMPAAIGDAPAETLTEVTSTRSETAAEVPPSAMAAVTGPANPAVSVVEHSQGYLMTIVPEGHTSGIRWMLPVTQE